ncbi:hypothetical protein [Planococcus sp. ANT_H30]|nr:hypothetical protein [Planococcus sp. ANT_H30]
MKMMSFMDDLSGAIFDSVKLFIYFSSGVIIVSIALYGIAGLLNLITL